MSGMMNTHGGRHMNGWLALSPLALFLCLYLVSSIVADDFYKVPIAAAFLLASAYALLITRTKGTEKKIAIFSSGAGNKNVLLMIWIFVLAGGLASSLGYILWYAIVPRYTLINLSIIQLAIPVITAIQGFIFLEEEVTVRFVISTCLILGGIYQTIRTNHIHIRK